MIELLGIPAAFADRVRGGWPEGRSKYIGYAMRQVIGACLLLQFTTDWHYFLMLPLIAHFSWQIDNGWRGRWVRWQIGAREFEADLILVAVKWAVLQVSFYVIGFVALPWITGLLDPLTSMLYLYPAYIVGILVTMFVSVKMPMTEFLNLRHAHPWSELLEFLFIFAALGVLT